MIDGVNAQSLIRMSDSEGADYFGSLLDPNYTMTLLRSSVAAALDSLPDDALEHAFMSPSLGRSWTPELDASMFMEFLSAERAKERKHARVQSEWAQVVAGLPPYFAHSQNETRDAPKGRQRGAQFGPTLASLGISAQPTVAFKKQTPAARGTSGHFCLTQLPPLEDFHFATPLRFRSQPHVQSDHTLGVDADDVHFKRPTHQLKKVSVPSLRSSQPAGCPQFRFDLRRVCRRRRYFGQRVAAPYLPSPRASDRRVDECACGCPFV